MTFRVYRSRGFVFFKSKELSLIFNISQSATDLELLKVIQIFLLNLRTPDIDKSEDNLEQVNLPVRLVTSKKGIRV